MDVVSFQRLAPTAVTPSRAHIGDAGLDLFAIDDVSLDVGERAAVGTGIAVALPDGAVALIAPRSGLADALGVTVLNSPGIVDSGYRGELKVLLINLGSEHVAVARGARVAQLLILQLAQFELREVISLPPSERGHSGFGSSGI